MLHAPEARAERPPVPRRVIRLPAILGDGRCDAGDDESAQHRRARSLQNVATL
jgi:hypothetical protein